VFFLWIRMSAFVFRSEKMLCSIFSRKMRLHSWFCSCVDVLDVAVCLCPLVVVGGWQSWQRWQQHECYSIVASRGNMTWFRCLWEPHPIQDHSSSNLHSCKRRPKPKKPPKTSHNILGLQSTTISHKSYLNTMTRNIVFSKSLCSRKVYISAHFLAQADINQILCIASGGSGCVWFRLVNLLVSCASMGCASIAH